ncbi:MAG: hypothetical protein JO006_17335 [Paucibacter sp.]|nr:hypothetical protein [Roseateles sp.]
MEHASHDTHTHTHTHTYTYTQGDIKTNGNQGGARFKPIDTNGRMKNNSGLTLWYEHNGSQSLTMLRNAGPT